MLYNNTVKINDHVRYVGVNDRKTRKFENMWPLDHGIAYNSYVILDEKTALLDTVHLGYYTNFEEGFQHVMEGRKLDYLVIHHMEPDHSGIIPQIIADYPDITIVGNARTKEFLFNFYQIEPKNFLEVKEGDTLSLGTTELTFYMTPMVHWPESMVSYESHYKILFSQDAFGGFGALDGGIFDDELNFDLYEADTIRYYVNIIGKLSRQVARAIDKLAPLDIQMICPVHGPVWRHNVERILTLYQDLSNQKKQEGVVIVYGSMYGNTERMANYMGRCLAQAGVKNIITHDVSKTDMSYILKDLWIYNGAIFGSCAYNNGLFPPMDNLCRYLVGQKMTGMKVGLFGGFSWSGGGFSGLQSFVKEAGWELLDPSFEFKSSPKTEHFQQAEQLAEAMAKAIKL